MKKFLFSSESVTEGHPDKVADKISDSILDAYLKLDPESLVACETLATTDFVLLAGEVHTRAKETPDFDGIVRQTIKEIGYVGADAGFDFKTCNIENRLHAQSADIRQGVVQDDSEIGAGDQGLMFGFACNETPELMPLPIWLAHKMTHRLAELRKTKKLPWLRPDGKAQVTLSYDGFLPEFLHTVVLSTQHEESIAQEEIHRAIKSEVIDHCVPKILLQRI